MKAPEIEVEGNIGYGVILPHVIQLLINEKCLSRACKADQHGGELQLDKHVKEELDPYGLRVVDQTSLKIKQIRFKGQFKAIKFSKKKCFFLV